MKSLTDLIVIKYVWHLCAKIKYNQQSDFIWMDNPPHQSAETFWPSAGQRRITIFK